jgi:hypothetical protein
MNLKGVEGVIGYFKVPWYLPRRTGKSTRNVCENRQPRF